LLLLLLLSMMKSPARLETETAAMDATPATLAAALLASSALEKAIEAIAVVWSRTARTDAIEAAALLDASNNEEVILDTGRLLKPPWAQKTPPESREARRAPVSRLRHSMAFDPLAFRALLR
jgi:hypothetical protein